MFKQITELNGDENYLIFSLIMFIVFFAIVGIMLIKMKKDYADHMSEMPLNDEEPDQENTQENQQA